MNAPAQREANAPMDTPSSAADSAPSPSSSSSEAPAPNAPSSSPENPTLIEISTLAFHASRQIDALEASPPPCHLPLSLSVTRFGVPEKQESLVEARTKHCDIQNKRDRAIAEYVRLQTEVKRLGDDEWSQKLAAAEKQLQDAKEKQQRVAELRRSLPTNNDLKARVSAAFDVWREETRPAGERFANKLTEIAKSLCHSSSNAARPGSRENCVISYVPQSLLIPLSFPLIDVRSVRLVLLV